MKTCKQIIIIITATIKKVPSDLYLFFSILVAYFWLKYGLTFHLISIIKQQTIGLECFSLYNYMVLLLNGFLYNSTVLLCCSHVVFSGMASPFHCHSTRFILFLGTILHTPGPLNPAHLTDNRTDQS